MFSVKKSQDIGPVWVAIIIFLAQVTGVFLPFLGSLCVAIGIIYFCGTIAAFQHHHGHCAVFKNKKSNDKAISTVLV